MTTPNGRGRGHKRKPITKRRARRIARYRIGTIIESALENGYNPDDLHGRYGDGGLDTILNEMLDLAKWLESTGHPDGRSSRF